MLAPSVSYNSPFRPVPAPKTRLLLITDSAERLLEIKSGISAGDFEITDVSCFSELRAASRKHYDLAVVDVGSGQIRPILSALRNNPRYASIPLLVDSTRLQENLSLAGVLPTFRAMACNRAEMRLLLQTYSHNSQSPEAGRLALL
ncbi:MAG TPA: hypothetical protein PLD20_29430 [Blastocatellia bacterium]|nr:hypothetical protein [Blastocatellia bacterium]HMY76514.1 hypothetical protein [Blastocatellia bacterium]HMZ22091.1 hypothetical protein [Blastocatellia bacterium]HNG30120.1 hypothetical protein [Blastocatellia bacterium]